jgi:hypothetical protein
MSLDGYEDLNLVSPCSLRASCPLNETISATTDNFIAWTQWVSHPFQTGVYRLPSLDGLSPSGTRPYCQLSTGN